MTAKRLYISADIEGVAGVVSLDHMMPGGNEYQQAREWMTAEVLAVSQSAFDAGISEVVVSDSHGTGQNLLLDKLPDNIQVVRSWPRPLCMMEGIQEGSYVGAIFLGYHTGASDVRGVLAHTLHGGAISEVRINGQVASETVISAATAGHFGVPVIMVSGDDAYTAHAHDLLQGVETVVTKWALSFTSARMLSPRLVLKNLSEGVKAALLRLDEFRVNRLNGPIDLDVQCVKRNAVELLEYLPNIVRLDAYTIRFVASDMVEVSRFLQFLLASGVLTPPK